jgi:hypothetical protein
MRMDIGAGAMIKQNIEHDLNDARIWDVASSKLLHIQLLNSTVFEEATGLAAPPTPIDANPYKEMGLPFYDFYRETPASTVAGEFEGLKMLDEL